MSIRQSGLCVHPQQTVIHPRHAAGSGSKRTHTPTHSAPPHSDSPPTDGGAAGSSVQLKLTHKPPAVTVTPRKKPHAR